MLRIVLLIYVSWCVVVYLLQDRLLFPRHVIAPPPPPPAEPLRRTLHVDLEDGGQVEGWFVPAPGASAEAPAPVVAFFHGNAELIDFQEEIIAGYHRLGCSVLLPEYRGYGRSSGKPSQANIRADAINFYDQITQREDVDTSRIVFHGRSIGSAVAVDLSTEREPAALVIQSCFRSIVRMGYRFGVPAFLARHPYRVGQVLTKSEIPLLIFHGSMDNIVPVNEGRALHALTPDSEYVEYDCGHNDLPPLDLEKEYWQRIKALLRGSGVLM